MLKYHNIAALFALTALMTACSDSDTETPDLPEKAQKVNLVISVATVESQPSAQSRATEEGDDKYTFEDPATDYEKMHTLRVIVVNADNRVEGNVPVTADAPTDRLEDITIPVMGGEYKDVYLIANEESVSYDFSALYDGAVFPRDVIADLTLNAPAAGQPIYDNSGAARSYLPMSEQFTVYVKEASEENFIQRETYFITRATVKFSFSFKSDGPVEADYNVAAVRFSSLADKQYFMPRNTEYLPSKYTATPSSSPGRLITAYDVPADVTYAPYTFMLPDGGFPVNSTLDAGQTPFLYFPESKFGGDEQKYYATVALSDRSNPSAGLTWFPEVELPNLPSLPRNTHVIINFELSGSTLNATVDVLPYTGVYLNPDFGIDRK